MVARRSCSHEWTAQNDQDIKSVQSSDVPDVLIGLIAAIPVVIASDFCEAI